MSRVEKENINVINILESNLPDIDSETLEAYCIVRETCPEILFVEDFNIPSEKLDFFTRKHHEIYSQKADEILDEFPDSLILSSGMFGGKTTLSFLLLDKLLQKKEKVGLLIADVMGEDFITARSYIGKGKRNAQRFGGLTDYEKTMDSLSKEDAKFIFLDEFSFLDVCIVEDLQNMCFSEDKHLVLTGLNSSYLGQPLPAFLNSRILENSKHELCKSFVAGFCEEEPKGTNTIRYVWIDNRWVLDMGLLPLVVSKELSHVVHYAPAMYEHTTVCLLEKHPELLENILFPSEQKQILQQNLLEKLV